MQEIVVFRGKDYIVDPAAKKGNCVIQFGKDRVLVPEAWDNRLPRSISQIGPTAARAYTVYKAKRV